MRKEIKNHITYLKGAPLPCIRGQNPRNGEDGERKELKNERQENVFYLKEKFAPIEKVFEEGGEKGRIESRKRK